MPQCPDCGNFFPPGDLDPEGCPDDEETYSLCVDCSQSDQGEDGENDDS